MQTRKAGRSIQERDREKGGSRVSYISATSQSSSKRWFFGGGIDGGLGREGKVKGRVGRGCGQGREDVGQACNAQTPPIPVAQKLFFFVDGGVGGKCLLC